MTRKTLLIGGGAVALLILVLAALAVWQGMLRSGQQVRDAAVAPAQTGAGEAAAQTTQGAVAPTPAPAAPGAAPRPAGAWDPGITASDHVLGAADAPVTMIEYASFTCSHCRDFHVETLPQIKQRYIDTGRLRLVYRDFPLDGLALRASMLARCAPPEQYFNLMHVLFENQRQWAAAADPLRALGQIGRMAGVGEQAFSACMEDRGLADRIIQERQQAEQQYQVDSTPTFIINGEKVSGAQPFDNFAAVIDRQTRSQ